eukprot:UN12267
MMFFQLFTKNIEFGRNVKKRFLVSFEEKIENFIFRIDNVFANLLNNRYSLFNVEIRGSRCRKDSDLHAHMHHVLSKVQDNRMPPPHQVIQR